MSAARIVNCMLRLGWPVEMITWGSSALTDRDAAASASSCSGTIAGRHRSPSGRAWRYCHRCHGTGARLRVGRRIWNYLRNLHKEGR